jgi:hypothetical protein
VVVAVAAVALVALNLHQYWNIGTDKLTIISIIAVPILAISCGIISRRKACKKLLEKNVPENNTNEQSEEI